MKRTKDASGTWFTTGEGVHLCSFLPDPDRIETIVTLPWDIITKLLVEQARRKYRRRVK